MHNFSSCACVYQIGSEVIFHGVYRLEKKNMGSRNLVHNVLAVLLFFFLEQYVAL